MLHQAGRRHLHSTAHYAITHEQVTAPWADNSRGPARHRKRRVALEGRHREGSASTNSTNGGFWYHSSAAVAAGPAPLTRSSHQGMYDIHKTPSTKGGNVRAHVYTYPHAKHPVEEWISPHHDTRVGIHDGAATKWVDTAHTPSNYIPGGGVRATSPAWGSVTILITT
jgi:hypothetical protein